MPVRTATKGDLRAIHALERAAFGSHCYPDFFFRQALDLWPAYLLVAEDDDDVLAGYGLGGAGTAPGEGWILSLAVAESCRGQGLGKALLQALLAALDEGGCRRQRLTVAPDNPALGLYLSLGFVEEGGEPDYFGPGEPRLVLVRG
ncbi:GNAT family N-acetyltransferase [Zobellella endophytica]|uniref:GNAT family N-acetyltransferase n=1 Tax=Zobellella endophytica TaxID=2116700 RepID=A0A2P7R3T8_9GAMM|nr:N-acetyltransferase [Zobellella endophytica]PSJ44871.1 GNAT family N-acetyltransferase [Zobellella endophytica]